MSTGIPAYDPEAARGPFYRAVAGFVGTRAGRAFAMKVSARVDPFLLRISGGRVGTGVVLPSAMLISTGARSGQPREAAVLYFSDGPDVILIASNFGQDRHPAWYHNLKAHPEAELECKGVRARYVATEVTDPSEHHALYAKATRVFGGYAGYARRTAAVGRRIPILRLSLTA